MPQSTNHRPIRSFVRREGRLTKAQARAMQEWWPRYGVDPGDDELDITRIFGRHAPTVLEIGFGNGESLATVAAAHPGNNYIGIEVHRPGVGGLLRRLVRDGIDNVRVICADAVTVLRDNLPDASLEAVCLFFPDPWPKKKHHKRRLVQPDFVARVRSKLRIGGRFHLATDWRDYAEHMMAVLSQAEGFNNTAGHGHYCAAPPDRSPTRFERRGTGLGHTVYDLVFERTD